MERTSWNDYEDIVSFKFTESIFSVSDRFKRNIHAILLSDIAQLNSKYSIIIYKWLSMNYNQYDYYNAKGGRREKQLNEYKNPIIPIEELRRITDTEKEYLKFSILKQEF
ncbi:Protein involved in initiation of plasmid replication [Enterococcus faecium]|nr:Protein involved in initiation of plasmid replication [Enterococcus faecium]